MTKFAVWSPGFQKNSGGVIALHKLVHDLKTLGEEVFLISESKNPEWLGRIGHPSEIDDFTIVLYPEIIVGNPFGAKHVARWLLNTVGAVGGDANSWGANDLVFKYCDYFTAPPNFDVAGELRTLDVQLDFWTQNLNRERNGECYMLRKGAWKPQNKHAANSVNIDHFGDNHNLRDILSQKEKFINYDHASFVSVQAALAGCLSIVVPDGINNAEQWREKFPQHKYGIAYGFSEAEVEHAKSTQHLVKEQMKMMEEQTIELVKNFVKVCKERVNG